MKDPVVIKLISIVFLLLFSTCRVQEFGQEIGEAYAEKMGQKKYRTKPSERKKVTSIADLRAELAKREKEEEED